MKILFVTPRLCYPDAPYAGENITFHLMKSLASRGHEMYLITGLLPGTRNHLADVKSFCTVLETIDVPATKLDIVTAVSDWLKRGFRGGLTVRKRAAFSVMQSSKKTHFDLIHVEHTALGEYIQKPAGQRTVIVAHDVLLKPALREYQLSRGIKKIINYMKYKMMKRKEIAIYRKFDKVYTLSDFDRKFLLNYCSSLDVSILSPFVKMEDSEERYRARESNSILFVGAMDRPVNGDAVRYFYKNVFPLIRSKVPEAKFYVVGNKPPEDILFIGRRDNAVVVTGFVKDINPFYHRASVLVAPLFVGGGIILKILNALAAGLPVVTTSIGNEGIEAVPEKAILVADSPDAFAQKVILLLKDDHRWQRMSSEGRRFVREKFNWDNIVRQVEEEYKKLVSAGDPVS